jgi:hypothetical protein
MPNETLGKVSLLRIETFDCTFIQTHYIFLHRGGFFYRLNVSIERRERNIRWKRSLGNQRILKLVVNPSFVHWSMIHGIVELP